MANKYSTFKLKPYVSQHVNSGEIEASKILRERWDTNRAEHDKLLRAANTIQVGSGDMQLRDDAISAVRKDFEGVVANNNYEDAGRVTADATTKFLSNEGLQLAAASYRNNEAGQKAKSELEMQGKTVLFDEEYVRDEEGAIVMGEDGRPKTISKFDSHKSFYTDENGKTVRNIYRPQGRMQLDYASRKAKIIGSIAKDPVALKRISELTGVAASDVEGFLVSGTGVSQEKANRISSALLDEYLQTNEGVQQMRKLTEVDIDPFTGDTYDAADAELQIQSELNSIASKQVGETLTYTQDPMYKALLEQAAQSNKVKVRMESYRMDVSLNSKVLTGADFLDLDKDFDSEGKLKPSIYKGNMPELFPVSVYADFLRKDFIESGMDRDAAVAKATAEIHRMRTEGYERANAPFKMVGGKKHWKLTLDKQRELEKEIFSLSGERADVRLRREMNAAKKEGRQPKMNILASHKSSYVKYMREEYKAAGIDTSKYTDKEFITKISAATKKYAVTAQKLHAPSNINLEGKAQELLRSTNLWQVRREDGSVTETKDDALLELGFKNGKGEWKQGAEELYDKYLAKVAAVSGITTAGSSPGSYIMNFRDSEGKDAKIELGAGEAQEAIFRASHTIISDLLSGNASTKVGVEKKTVLTQALITAKSGEVVRAVQEVYYELDAESLGYVPVVMQSYYDAETGDLIKSEYKKGIAQVEQMINTALDTFEKSGILGADVTVAKKSESTNPAT